MTDTVTIPAEAIADTREALLGVLHEPAQGIGHALTQPERELPPEWLAKYRGRFAEICELLDLIGWDASEPPHTVQVPGRDAQTIGDALRNYLPIVEQWLHEADRLRAQREHRDSLQAIWALLKALPAAHCNSGPLTAA